jgi:cytochrome c oxidase assembly protein subunit 15
MKSRLKGALSPLLGLLLFLQSSLVVTGGAVRLTGSGLGCPTWPRCTSGSYTPVPHQAQGQVHAWIEFGNRLLTFALIIVSVAALTAVIKSKRRDIRALAIGQLVGIFAQIPLGGITVLTHLNPVPVAGHFLLSIILIAFGTTLFSRRNLDAPKISPVQTLLWRLSKLHLGFVIIVIVVGTMVTGTGPNAGDASAPRFKFQLDHIVWIHASLAIALILLTIWMYSISSNDIEVRKRISIFTAAVILPGAIGFIQYYNGLPQLVVGSHLIGVSLLWISAWRIHLATPSASHDPAPHETRIQ